MVRSKESFASPSPSATGCTVGSPGPFLFVSTAHAGQINPLLSIAGELSRRGVPGLWIASTDNRRADIEGAATGSPIHFVSSNAERVVDRTVALGLSRSRFGSAAPDECRAETRESLVSIPSPKRNAHAISIFVLCQSSHGNGNSQSVWRFRTVQRCCDGDLLYSVFGLEYPFPVPRHLHLVGAMVPSNLPAIQDSNDELSRWLDSHPSVIYVGLGTLVRLSHVQMKALITAFKCLEPNHHILWKLSDSQQTLLPRGDLLP